MAMVANCSPVQASKLSHFQMNASPFSRSFLLVKSSHESTKVPLKNGETVKNRPALSSPTDENLNSITDAIEPEPPVTPQQFETPDKSAALSIDSMASVSRSILKKRSANFALDDSILSSAQKRRVIFADPVVSSQRLFFRDSPKSRSSRKKSKRNLAANCFQILLPSAHEPVELRGESTQVDDTNNVANLVDSQPICISKTLFKMGTEANSKTIESSITKDDSPLKSIENDHSYVNFDLKRTDVEKCEVNNTQKASIESDMSEISDSDASTINYDCEESTVKTKPESSHCEKAASKSSKNANQESCVNNVESVDTAIRICPVVCSSQDVKLKAEPIQSRKRSATSDSTIFEESAPKIARIEQETATKSTMSSSIIEKSSVKNEPMLDESETVREKGNKNPQNENIYSKLEEMLRVFDEEGSQETVICQPLVDNQADITTFVDTFASMIHKKWTDWLHLKGVKTIGQLAKMTKIQVEEGPTSFGFEDISDTLKSVKIRLDSITKTKETKTTSKESKEAKKVETKGLENSVTQKTVSEVPKEVKTVSKIKPLEVKNVPKVIIQHAKSFKDKVTEKPKIHVIEPTFSPPNVSVKSPSKIASPIPTKLSKLTKIDSVKKPQALALLPISEQGNTIQKAVINSATPFSKKIDPISSPRVFEILPAEHVEQIKPTEPTSPVLSPKIPAAVDITKSVLISYKPRMNPKISVNPSSPRTEPVKEVQQAAAENQTVLTEAQQDEGSDNSSDETKLAESPAAITSKIIVTEKAINAKSQVFHAVHQSKEAQKLNEIRKRALIKIISPGSRGSQMLAAKLAKDKKSMLEKRQNQPKMTFDKNQLSLIEKVELSDPVTDFVDAVGANSKKKEESRDAATGEEQSPMEIDEKKNCSVQEVDVTINAEKNVEKVLPVQVNNRIGHRLTTGKVNARIILQRLTEDEISQFLRNPKVDGCPLDAEKITAGDSAQSSTVEVKNSDQQQSDLSDDDCVVISEKSTKVETQISISKKRRQSRLF